jgi:UDP-glucose:(heptosyl)LPS alpha-1,3-glucosyltransferase
VAPGDLLTVTIAHNFRLKGVRRWMEALALLGSSRAQGLRALVIGKGDTPAWHRLASRLGVDGRLTFIGATDRVPAFLHAADVLVHPTYYDPCSRVVLEGLLAGLPCITTRWDGAAEVIHNGENGFVLDDPWDVQALAATVERLRDAELRRSVGEAAARVGERVSMAANARAMIDLYHSVAEGKS